MKKSPVISSSVATRDGDIITPRPMATYVESSQRAVIRDALPSQSIERDRRDGIVMLRPADYYKPEAHAMFDIGIFLVGLTAGLVSSSLVFLALHLGGLL